MQVFISYAKEDYKIAKRLYHDLKSRNLNPWMDRKNLLIGQKWKVAIPKAIRKSSHFLALLSSQSVSKKGFVQRELKIAMDVLEDMPGSEIFILPLLLDEACELPEGKLADFHCGELFPSYEAGLSQVLLVLRPETSGQKESVDDFETTADADISDVLETFSPTPKHCFRSEPRTLSEEDVKAVVVKFDFSVRNWNKSGTFENDFKDNGNETVTDRLTDLMWQKGGSENHVPYNDAEAYIKKLNEEEFAGYNDWRLPTIEELSSLLENENRNDVYIDPVFYKNQWWCWSADKRDLGSAWYVGFYDHSINWRNVNYDGYVRGIRTLRKF